MVRNSTQKARFLAQVAGALVRHPDLIPTAVRQAVSLAPRRWWATRPHLPIPPAAYLEFRNVTLSGDADQLPEPHDVIVWLEWCRSMRTLPERA